VESGDLAVRSEGRADQVVGHPEAPVLVLGADPCFAPLIYLFSRVRFLSLEEVLFIGQGRRQDPRPHRHQNLVFMVEAFPACRRPTLQKTTSGTYVPEELGLDFTPAAMPAP